MPVGVGIFGYQSYLKPTTTTFPLLNFPANMIANRYCRRVCTHLGLLLHSGNTILQAFKSANSVNSVRLGIWKRSTADSKRRNLCRTRPTCRVTCQEILLTTTQSLVRPSSGWRQRQLFISRCSELASCCLSGCFFRHTKLWLWRCCCPLFCRCSARSLSISAVQHVSRRPIVDYRTLLYRRGTWHSRRWSWDGSLLQIQSFQE